MTTPENRRDVSCARGHLGALGSTRKKSCCHGLCFPEGALRPPGNVASRRSNLEAVRQNDPAPVRERPRPALASHLKHEKLCDAVTNPVVVRLRDAHASVERELDKSALGDCRTEERVVRAADHETYSATEQRDDATAAAPASTRSMTWVQKSSVGSSSPRTRRPVMGETTISMRKSGEMSAGSSPRAIPRAMTAAHCDSKWWRNPRMMARTSVLPSSESHARARAGVGGDDAAFALTLQRLGDELHLRRPAPVHGRLVHFGRASHVFHTQRGVADARQLFGSGSKDLGHDARASTARADRPRPLERLGRRQLSHHRA
jgi:hypothetical protein